MCGRYTITVNTTISGTTTLDYWAQVPGANFLHATRTVIGSAPANDNQATSTPAAANDNSPIAPIAATGTDATSTP